MDKRVLVWLKSHLGTVVSSPRKDVFRRNAQDFEIVDVDEQKERVKIRFEERNSPALPLTFLMFDRAIEYIVKNRGEFVRLGTSIYPQPNTVEGEIWKKPYPIEYKTTFKVASHVCDILVLADVAKYGIMQNPSTRKKVQAIKLTEQK